MPVAEHSTTAATRSVGRRALLGLALLLLMTGGGAGLLYGSIEPGLEFSADPDAARRQSLLAPVASWTRVDEFPKDGMQSFIPAHMIVIEAKAVSSRKLSAAQKLVEGLQSGAEGVRRPVLAALPLEPELLANKSQSGKTQAALEELQARGVDGAFLDAAAAFARARAGGAAEEQRLATAIVETINRARQINPTFLVVLENASELGTDPRIQRAIDGAARSDLLFGQEAAGVANNRTEIIAALHDLNRLKRAGRPIFITERIAHEHIAARAGVRQTLAALGFVGRFEPLKRAD